MLRNYISKLWTAISGGPIRLTLERTSAHFLLSATRRGAIVNIGALARKHPAIGDIVRLGSTQNDVLIVPVGALTDIRLSLMRITEDFEVVIAPDVAVLQPAGPPEGFGIEYTFDTSTQALKRTFTTPAEYFGNGWFVDTRTYWNTPSLANNDSWLAVGDIQGAEVLPFLRNQLPQIRARNIPVRCDLAYSAEPVVSFKLAAPSDDMLELSFAWAVPPGNIVLSAHIDGHVFASGSLRPGVAPDVLGKPVSLLNGTIRYSHEEIPHFVVECWPRIKQLTADTAPISGHRIIQDGELRLAVTRDEHDGIGLVTAVPWFFSGDLRVRAEELSSSLEKCRDFIRVAGGWLPTAVVEKAGVARFGRAADGTPLAPLTLTPEEILRRALARLNGPWARKDFPEIQLPAAGSSEAAVSAQLEFLRAWGLPGGIVGTLTQHHALLLRFLTNFVTANPGTRVLVVGARRSLDTLGEGWVSAAAARFDGLRKDPEFSAAVTGIVLASPKAFEVVPGLSTLQWHILVLLEADALIKTGSSKLFESLSECPRYVAIGLFAGHEFLRRSSQREALGEVMHLPRASDALWRQLVRNCEEAVPEVGALSAPPATAPVRRTSPAEFTIGTGTADGVPIPVRPESGTYEYEIRVSFSTPADDFVKQAREKRAYRVNSATFVPFMCYWPTYASMNRQQQQWYFFWRDRVRNGQFPDTDLSYIFVHVYELLNGVGGSDAYDGYRQLRSLWLAYRERYSKLDNYLPDWIADYVLMYGCEIDPVQPYLDLVAFGETVEEPDLVLPRYAGPDSARIPLPLLSSFGDYRVNRSKFYLDGYGQVVDERVPELFREVDAHLAKTRGKRILDLYRPRQSKTVQRNAFRSAVFCGDDRVVNLGTVYPYSEHAPFRDFITAFLKHAENKLRQANGYRSRLRGYSLDSDIQAVLDALILPPQAEREQVRAAAAASAAKIVIDLGRVRELTTESDVVREMLLAGNTDVGPSPSLPISSGMHCSDSVADEKFTILRPADTPPGLLTDLEPVWNILRRLDQNERQIIGVLMEKGWEAEAGVLQQSLPDALLEAELERINGLARKFLGDLLIISEAGKIVIAEDYRDELEFLANREQVKVQSYPAAQDLPSEWGELLRRLEPHQLLVLQALVQNTDSISQIGRIADEHAMMPQDLIERINEVAFDTIGDAIIAPNSMPPVIEEEDLEYVQKLVNSVN
ncbi:MAG: TerB N-terminal domain-containing protein [Terriglobales bacterium]